MKSDRLVVGEGSPPRFAGGLCVDVCDTSNSLSMHEAAKAIRLPNENESDYSSDRVHDDRVLAGRKGFST